MRNPPPSVLVGLRRGGTPSGMDAALTRSCARAFHLPPTDNARSLPGAVRRRAPARAAMCPASCHNGLPFHHFFVYWTCLRSSFRRGEYVRPGTTLIGLRTYGCERVKHFSDACTTVPLSRLPTSLTTRISASFCPASCHRINPALPAFRLHDVRHPLPLPSA